MVLTQKLHCLYNSKLMRMKSIFSKDVFAHNLTNIKSLCIRLNECALSKDKWMLVEDSIHFCIYSMDLIRMGFRLTSIVVPCVSYIWQKLHFHLIFFTTGNFLHFHEISLNGSLSMSSSKLPCGFGMYLYLLFSEPIWWLAIFLC